MARHHSERSVTEPVPTVSLQPRSRLRVRPEFLGRGRDLLLLQVWRSIHCAPAPGRRAFSDIQARRAGRRWWSLRHFWLVSRRQLPPASIAHNTILVHDPSETWPNIRAGQVTGNDGGQAHTWPHHNGAVTDADAWNKERRLYDIADIATFADYGTHVYVAGDCTRSVLAEEDREFYPADRLRAAGDLHRFRSNCLPPPGLQEDVVAASHETSRQVAIRPRHHEWPRTSVRPDALAEGSEGTVDLRQ